MLCETILSDKDFQWTSIHAHKSITKLKCYFLPIEMIIPLLESIHLNRPATYLIADLWIEENTLFVFQNDDSQQNVNYFLTPVFNSVFNALSHGALRFALHGSSNIHFLIG